MAASLTQPMQFSHHRSRLLHWVSPYGDTYDIQFDADGEVINHRVTREFDPGSGSPPRDGLQEPEDF